MSATTACGYRKTWLALRRAGVEVGRDRVERLIRTHGVQGAKRRGKPWRTTIPDPAAARLPDLVDRDFTATGPDALWVADFCYLRCWEGIVFFSFVIDAYSRRVVGWQFSTACAPTWSSTRCGWRSRAGTPAATCRSSTIPTNSRCSSYELRDSGLPIEVA
jgi:putative transposase